MQIKIIFSKYIPFNHEAKMRKTLIRKCVKSLKGLYKCKVAWMRNKGWSRILRQSHITLRWKASNLGRKGSEKQRKQLRTIDGKKGHPKSHLLRAEKTPQNFHNIFLCTVSFCCHLVTTIVEKSRPIKQDWLLGRWSIAAVKGEKTDKCFFPLFTTFC